MPKTSGETSIGGDRRDFPETSPGLLLPTTDSSPEVRRGGFDDLARRYWKPVYHTLRAARSRTNEDAKDLTQAFFLWLVEGGVLSRYRPDRGSFRKFLKGCLRNFVRHEEEALGRLKRGGGALRLRLDDDAAPLRDVLPDPRAVDPGRAFDDAWRAALMDAAVDRVRARHGGDDPDRRFRVFEEYTLGPPDERPTYSALAERHAVKASDVMNDLVALRDEICSEIRSALAAQVSGPEELEEEWHAFFGS